MLPLVSNLVSFFPPNDISVLSMLEYLQCNIIGGLVDFVRSLVGATLDDDSSQTH